MRDSLKKSAADSPVRNFERYAKGSIVLCHSCTMPIFKLDAGIWLGDKSGRMADRFKPVGLVDLVSLADRLDIDAGIRAKLKSLSVEQLRAHVARLHDMKSGDEMVCPACHGCFVQVLSVDRTETLDKAYTVELLTIPPDQAGAPMTPKRISASGEWLH